MTSRTISCSSPHATRLAMKVICIESSPFLVSIRAITQVHLSKLVVFARPGPTAKPGGRRTPLVNHALPNPSNGNALFWKRAPPMPPIFNHIFWALRITVRDVTFGTSKMSIELLPERALSHRAGQDFGPDRETQNGEPEHIIPVLPPTDSGRQAWSYLMACFVVEAVLWGKLPRTFLLHALLALIVANSLSSRLSTGIRCLPRLLCKGAGI
jgi:hypothetical protein